MTKKLILGIVIAAVLLSSTLFIFGEESQPTSLAATLTGAQQDCGCFDQNQAPRSQTLKPPATKESPNLMMAQHCVWVCGWHSWVGFDGVSHHTWECVCLPVDWVNQDTSQ